MAVQAQFGGLVHPPPYAYAAEMQQMRAVKQEQDYGALLSAAAAAATPVGDGGGYAWQQFQHDYCAAQSELTCNDGGGVGAVAVPTPPSRKRGREDDDDDLLHYAAFLPLPVMRRSHSATPASASGRPAEISAADALASEVWRYDTEVDALVRAECARLRAGLEAARERQWQALVRAAASSALARRAREAEAQLEAARRRAAELEERVRLAAAEAQAWCGVARGNEAVAAGLQTTLDALLLRSTEGAQEGFGESVPDDAQSCCGGYVEEKAADTAASSANGRWACRACGDGEASVLVLPCRHLCLCKACEPRTDACPVCSGAKNAAIHIAPPN